MIVARPRGGERRVAVTLVGCLALTLLGVVAPAASADDAATSFATSFETSEPSPHLSTPYGVQTNVSGRAYAPGSLLPKVATVAATAENPPSEVAANLIDANAGTKWLARATTATVTYTMTEPAVVRKYSLTSGNDSPERDPKNFALEGSNDATTWTPIDTRTGISFAKRGEQQSFTTSNETAYSAYRLVISANHGDSMIQLADFELNDGSDDTGPVTPMIAELGVGPMSSPTAKSNVGFTGKGALLFSGTNLADGAATGSSDLFDVDVVVGDATELTYKVFPVFNSDMHYAATYLAVDLVFSDGSKLSSLGARDSYGFGASARGQGEAKVLATNQWNSVRIDLGAYAGKHVAKIVVSYDNPNGVGGSALTAWFDDISLADAAGRDTSDGLVSYVDTRRGTHSSGAFSRGNNLPITAMPNGFNFFTPMTDADSQSWEYSYHQGNNSNNKPTLQAIGISHEPSPWMGDRNQLAIMPSPSSTPDAGRGARALEFDHRDEIARPDLYSVRFTNQMTAALTPTDHGAVYRFGYPGPTGSVIVDRVSTGESKFAISPEGVVSGWTENGSGLSVGRSRMFFYGEFDTKPTSVGPATVGGRPAAQVATFAIDGKPVELRLATSFISLDQAKRNHDLEVKSVAFDTVRAAAIEAWNDRLGVIEVAGARDTQRETLYSNLYRLNLYPNSQFENTGTAQAPVYRYASPTAPRTSRATDTATNAAIVDGKMYVNNGFWDTYRTVWPAYAFFYPELAEELADGFVQQYRDGGWVARWSSPGYADLMTGTSSDVSFAEAYLAGALPTNKALDAYDAALKNATVVSTQSGAGRKGLETSIFLGFTAETTGESVSWGLEGFINDFGIATMAAKLAEDPATPVERVAQLKEESQYFFARSQGYANMFNPEAEFFTSRRPDGTFSQGADFDPTRWWGAFTETNGWNFAFHVPFDVDGLAALYGGGPGLVAKLDEFFSTPETSMGSIHEEIEAREVRMGQLGMSNQPSHHIPYMYAAAGEPAKSQAVIREILDRLYVGSDIGQGYFGDEDNGEMSAWYLFSSLGFYPLEVGSGDYTIGSPLFDKATVHRPGGDLVITAPGASSGKQYVAGARLDGTAITSVSLDGAALRDASELSFTMSDKPSVWGMRTLDAAPVEVMIDAGQYGTYRAGDSPVPELSDDNARSASALKQSDPLVWSSSTGPVTLTSYTLTNAGDAWPTGWTLEGSNDGVAWASLDVRAEEAFRWKTQTRPFLIAEPAAFLTYRLTFTGDVSLGEVELFGGVAAGDELEIHPRPGVTGRPGIEVTQALATISGGAAEAPVVTADFLDGNGPVPATVVKNALGAWEVIAGHVFGEPGVYDVVLTARRAGEVETGITAAAASAAVARVTITRDAAADMFDMTCIGDRGVGADCDGQAWAFDRALLAETGFVQGTTIAVPGTDLTFDLPAAKPGRGDNLTPRGQTIALDLGAGAEQFSVIGTATEKGQTISAQLTYTDGTTQSVDIAFGDWVGAARSPAYGNIVVGTSAGRLSGATGSDGQTSGVFATKPIDLLAGKTVASLTLPTQTGEIRSGRIHIFAFASDGARVVPEPLVLEPAEGISVVVGEEFSGVLATATGGDGSALSATVNFGDLTAVTPARLTEGAVSAPHRWALAGSYTLTVTVSDATTSMLVDVPVTVTDPVPLYPTSLAVSPVTAAPGDEVSLRGEGFAPGENVEVVVSDIGSTTVNADDTGAFTLAMRVPAGTPDGTYPARATGATSVTPALAEVRVLSPVVPTVQVSLTPSAGRPGDTIHVVGSGFGGGEQVVLTLRPLGLSLGGAVADAQGGLAFDLVIPAAAPVGDHRVEVAGATTGRSVLVDLSVLPGEGGSPEPTPSPGESSSASPTPSVSPVPSASSPGSGSGSTTGSSGSDGSMADSGADLWSALLAGWLVLTLGALVVYAAYRRRSVQN